MWGLFKKKEIVPIKKKDYPPMVFSVKSIVMFETMTGKNFNDLAEEDMAVLLYCVFVCSSGIRISYDAFLILMEDKNLALKLSKDLTRLQKFTMQFKGEKTNGGEPSETNDGFSITTMVDRLIYSFGLDVDYVMNKMELWELEHFFKGAEEQYHEKMEEQRLWTFLQVAPQIDLKKVKTPEKLLPFSWEQEKEKNTREKQLEAETKTAQNIIGMKIDI